MSGLSGLDWPLDVGGVRGDGVPPPSVLFPPRFSAGGSPFVSLPSRLLLPFKLASVPLLLAPPPPPASPPFVAGTEDWAIIPAFPESSAGTFHGVCHRRACGSPEVPRHTGDIIPIPEPQPRGRGPEAAFPQHLPQGPSTYEAPEAVCGMNEGTEEGRKKGGLCAT